VLALVTLIASGDPSATPYAVGMAVGFLVGTFGHVIKATPVILLGIVMLGATCALFVIATNPWQG
jgi:hypothetical protein